MSLLSSRFARHVLLPRRRGDDVSAAVDLVSCSLAAYGFALDWINTYYPLLVPNFLATNAFYIFLMVQFMRSLPRELDDAARIDGCGPFRTFWSVIMPLCLPAFATTAIFTFISVWNEFFGPLIYLTDSELYTVPLALRQFVDSEGQSQWGQMFAMSFLSLAPVIVLHRRPEVPGQGNRDDGAQMSPPGMAGAAGVTGPQA